MGSADVQQGMMDEHGEEWKDWCIYLHESMQNARDITMVTSKVGQEELNNIFPGNGTEYNIRFGYGSTQPTLMPLA